MFDFAYIAPTNYLSYVPTTAKVHMVLVHLLTDPVYRGFYQGKINAGDKVILDNSAFELGKPMPTEQIFDIIRNTGFYPSMVIAPDFPGESASLNHKSFKEFVKLLRHAKTGNQRFDDWAQEVKIMAIPQTEKGEATDWFVLYNYYFHNSDVDTIGISFLSCTNAFCDETKSQDGSINRIHAAVNVKQKYDKLRTSEWAPKHHFLGMVQPYELAIQNSIGLINSCDSSSPIWHGINGVAYDDSFGGLRNGKIAMPVDFGIQKPSDQSQAAKIHADISHNIEYIERVRQIP